MFSILLYIFLSATRAQAVEKQLAVWNVGQGLWVTLISDDQCEHFDAGGEFAPFDRIEAVCRPRMNYLHLSHWDWDHISLTKAASETLPKFCLKDPPRGKTESQSKINLISRLKNCDAAQFTQIDDARSVQKLNEKDAVIELSWSPVKEQRRRKHPTTNRAAAATNDESRVYFADESLITGDSPRRQELQWSCGKRFSQLAQRTHILVLGHHGSKTSTSEELLARLPNLRQAIASARFARYGHPHEEVVRRLKSHGIALLRTEDWGSLIFNLPSSGVAPGNLLTVDKVDIPYLSCAPQARSKPHRRKR